MRLISKEQDVPHHGAFDMRILGHHKQPGAGCHGLEGELQGQGQLQAFDDRGKQRCDFLNFFKI